LSDIKLFFKNVAFEMKLFFANMIGALPQTPLHLALLISVSLQFFSLDKKKRSKPVCRQAGKNQVKIKLSSISNKRVSPIHTILTRPRMVKFVKKLRIFFS